MGLSRSVATGIAAAGLLIAAACHDGHEPKGEWHDIAESGWSYGDSLVFNSIHDTVETRAVALTVRHTNAYAYANLWVELEYATGDTTRTDTFNVVLADDFGRWYGRGSGVSFLRTDTLVPSRSVRPGSELRLRHIMRVDTIREIEQVGLSY